MPKKLKGAKKLTMISMVPCDECKKQPRIILLQFDGFEDRDLCGDCLGTLHPDIADMVGIKPF